MTRTKRDAQTGVVIAPGTLYRTYYRGLPHECYSVVEEDCDRVTSGERITAEHLRRHPEDADRVPPIEIA